LLFLIKPKKTIIKSNKKSNVLLERWQKTKPQERWGALAGWAQKGQR